ncbi:MAG: hypothetical protein LIR50_07495 [Bacillota bacterium]|nr:hypothetical protein [Bacillota bacterium]
MKQYFLFRETSNKGWTICPNYDLLGANYLRGSYFVLAARFMGISWPNWLRLCRNNGARLYGKNSLYTTAIWEKPNQDFLDSLNKRVNEIASKITLKELDY